MNSSVTTNLVEQCLDELEPIMARQRKEIAREGCFRAISSTHLHVLFLLTSEGPQPMGRLAEQLSVSMPNVTGIVDRMVAHGLVERLRDDDDRRLVVVSATESGRATVYEIDLVKRRLFSQVLEELDTHEQSCVLEAFQTLNKAISRLDSQAGRDTAA